MSRQFQLSTLVQKRLRDLDVTAEDVIRKALEIKAEGFDAGEGVYFPEGTALLSWYKDNAHVARVFEGDLVVNNKPFSSISGAAAEITGRKTTNGWDFWISVKFPGKNELIPLKSLRKPPHS